MSLVNLLYFLLIGLIAGWLAGKLTKGRSFGLAGDLVVGCIGSVIGGFLFGGSGLIISILVATLGALILLFIIKQLKSV